VGASTPWTKAHGGLAYYGAPFFLGKDARTGTKCEVQCSGKPVYLRPAEWRLLALRTHPSGTALAKPVIENALSQVDGNRSGLYTEGLACQARPYAARLRLFTGLRGRRPIRPRNLARAILMNPVCNQPKHNEDRSQKIRDEHYLVR
jgi:hypothetical protein